VPLQRRRRLAVALPASLSSDPARCHALPLLCLLQVQGVITLWPRQNWVTDLQYLHAYYSAGEASCLLVYAVHVDCCRFGAEKGN
jgi:hypothetical protein